MAAFQICSQLWLATSLLADGLAVAAQTVLASAFANNDLNEVVAATSCVLQLSIVLGMSLALVLGVAMRFGSRVFTNETDVIYVIYKGIPVSMHPSWQAMFDIKKRRYNPATFLFIYRVTPSDHWQHI